MLNAHNLHICGASTEVIGRRGAVTPPPPGSVSVVDGFYCLCSPGFAGPRCEQDVDDCANSLCSANSVCRDRHLVSWTFFFLLGLSVTDMYEIAFKKKKEL